ncbi:hypothetical protein PHYPSEUDO_008460 [Phytophthora pseudosyringae]|uniref:Uncharacterized protein n=1 Tax=Phytophthora pseudosyringae TaxID=221518 RepID=A0A8T1VE18_9STRA|nr:hypothetical protein PHYPSEUDO_008460 [Phytophthora pseudosyringae]
MAEAPGGDEASNGSNTPFDAQTSDRDPFPSFEAALADEQSADESEQQDAGSALDWSIDTLAELKPVAFSPLPQQKDAASTSGTPHGTSGFFDDEKQYAVLRTPLPAARTRDGEAASESRSQARLTPPMDLRRRCGETVARCKVALRERQRKVDKLQAVLPPPTPKRSPRRRSVHQSATSTSPPRPAKRNRLSTAVTPSSKWKSPGMRPPKWSASPIAMLLGSSQPLCATPATLRFDAMTPSPVVNSPRNTTPKQSSKLRLSFGLSPITFPSPEGKIEEEKSGEGAEETLPLSSSTEESAASGSEKENGDQQARQKGGSASSHGTSSRNAMRTPAAKEAVALTRSSIPRRRQQAFMEAMEAEACGNRSPLAAAPPSSLCHEAKRLGVTDPQAQWQYLQTTTRDTDTSDELLRVSCNY